MRTKKKLGEMLISANFLTEEKLAQSLAEQKDSKMKLGQYLIHKGIVKEAEIIDLISQQLKIERYHPDKYPVRTDLSKIISGDIAQEYQLAPLQKIGRLLKIAMTDPMDIKALDTIEVISAREVEPLICSEKELNQLIGSIYGFTSGIDGILEGMEDMGYSSSMMAKEEELQIASLHDLAEQPPVVRLVNSIISQAVREGASDIHISPEAKIVNVRFRIDGKLHGVPSPPKSMILSIVSRVKILANMDIANFRIPQDGRFTVKLGNKYINIRVSTIPTIYGENLVMRILDTSAGVASLDQLGLTDEDMGKIEAIIERPYGMILSTGPTGSGKSTSLFSIIKKVNKPEIHSITLEDPVEYKMDKVRQIQLNIKAGMTFASGLRSILRQDPDVILVGEIRDSETASIAVQAALTGHRLLSTLHTNDAAGAITRLADMGVDRYLISSVLLVSIAQRLVRTICPYCTEAYKPSSEALEFWGIRQYDDANFQRGRGCNQCMDIGYKGRTAIFEVLAIDDDVQEMIVKGMTSQDIRRATQRAGKLTTLKENAASKVFQGITTFEEAASAVIV